MQASRAVTIFLSTIWLVGCEQVTDIALPPAVSVARANAVHFWEAGASVGWNEIALSLSRKYHDASSTRTAREMALVSVAQDRAVKAAHSVTGADRPSKQAAVAGASAAVLTYLYPAEAAFLEAQVRAQESGEHWPGETHTSFALGESIGRAAAQPVIAHGQTDGSNAVWVGTVPTGPGHWIPAPPPAVPATPLWGSITPWLMNSGSQFRPDPPPAFGSPGFLSDVAEIRLLSDTRTAQQLAIAQFWNSNVPTYWNTLANELIVRYRLNEARAAEALALVNMAMMDASIGCWDAKYTYWFIRPWQADPAITTPIGRPNHPSYPSAHSCFSGAAVVVLSALFPAEQGQLAQQLNESALARMYGGLHYRFDTEAGAELGRQVAVLALSRRGGI